MVDYSFRGFCNASGFVIIGKKLLLVNILICSCEAMDLLDLEISIFKSLRIYVFFFT